MEKEGKGYSEEQEVFLVYLEDDDRRRSIYAHIILIKDGLMTFRTDKNKITIPTDRIIKIKGALR